MLGVRGGFDQDSGVTGLAVRPFGDIAQLLLVVAAEELAQHRIGLIEHVLGEVVRGVDKAVF